MGDKELQQLFEAKRTVEANRRRQEELAAMIAGKNKRTHPLWPVWISAAAASVALLIITLPTLFHDEQPAPTVVAQVETPVTVSEPTEQPESLTSPKTAPVKHTMPTTQTAEPLVLEAEPADIVKEPANTIEEPAIVPATQPIAPTRRVMRRTSTLIACTEGCPAPVGIKERQSTSIQIDFSAPQEYADATLITIGRNK